MGGQEEQGTKRVSANRELWDMRAAYTQALKQEGGKFAFVSEVHRSSPELFESPGYDLSTVIANAEIHPSVRIGANCSIGLPGFGYAKAPDGSWLRFPHVGNVVIEADVEIGSNVCIDRGALSDTRIGRGVKIDNLVHIAHNVVIGEDTMIAAHAMIGGSVTLGAGVWVAPGVMIMNQATIGDGATLGLGAVVLGDVAAGVTVVGNPARPLK